MSDIVKNLPFADYLARPGVNGTILKAVDRYSLAHARAILDGVGDDEESAAQELGTSFHALLLEGRIDYEVHPATYLHPKEGEKKWNWNANACKEWALPHEQASKTILTEGAAKSVEAMVASVHDELRGIDLAGDRELSVFAEKDGLPVKCRVDLLPKNGPVIDFKSAACAQPEEFLRQSLKLRYHLQCAWILDVLRWAGIDRKEVWLVGVESKPPFACCVLKFADIPCSFLRVGRRHCRTAFQQLKNAYESKLWPGYGQHPAENFAPKWQMDELEQTA